MAHLSANFGSTARSRAFIVLVKKILRLACLNAPYPLRTFINGMRQKKKKRKLPKKSCFPSDTTLKMKTKILSLSGLSFPILRNE